LNLPILKWVGGKRELLPFLTDNLPFKFNHYYEPFVGGGALLATILRDFPHVTTTINDSNHRLINLYQRLKANAPLVAQKLNLIEQRHLSRVEVTPKDLQDQVLTEYYNDLREVFNDDQTDATQSAALFIYLNKTCFHGLFRENKKGDFNVPTGHYKFLNLPTNNKIIKAGESLSKTRIFNQNYFEFLRNEQYPKSSFIYLDPPYLPIKSNFTNYTGKGFNYFDHKTLASLMDFLTEKEVHVMLSNSNHPIIKELFSSYRIQELEAPRSINIAKAEDKTAKELLITNY